MPIYAYRCDRDHLVEILTNTARAREDKHMCPECGLRLFRSFTDEKSNIRFKGFGLSSKSFDHIPVNDHDDPWEGTALEGKGRPGPNYKSTKLFLDYAG